jgi:hypothetical protein
MKHRLIRMLIREVIEASPSSSPSTATAPDSPAKDQDGGDATSAQPPVTIEKFFSNTKNASEVKQNEEIKKLAAELKKSGVTDEASIMSNLKALDRDEPGGVDFAKKILDAQTSTT